jgi:hypothetical protein
MYCKLKEVLLNMLFAQKQVRFSLFLFIFSMAACQPDDEVPFIEDAKPLPPSFVYSASINGVFWDGKQNVSLLVKNSSSSPSKEMRITANATDLKNLNITLSDVSTGIAGDGIAVKTYTLEKGAISDAAFSYSEQGANNYTGAYGTVRITKSDAANKKITGTFSCTLYKTAGDTLRVTNGIITDLPYTIFEQ